MSGAAARQPRAWTVWVIYDKPADFPNCFVARRWTVMGTQLDPTTDLIICPQLEIIRTHMRSFGFRRFDRLPADDACVVETWL